MAGECEAWGSQGQGPFIEESPELLFGVLHQVKRTLTLNQALEAEQMAP